MWWVCLPTGCRPLASFHLYLSSLLTDGWLQYFASVNQHIGHFRLPRRAHLAHRHCSAQIMELISEIQALRNLPKIFA